MSTITNNGAIPASVLASINGTSSSSSSSSSNSNELSAQAIQDRFLNLLVTQMQNQDPLNPMDNAQMTTQLAQISTLDAISQLNTTMQSLLSANTDNQALQAAGLIGKNVLVTGDNLSLSQGEAIGGLNLAENASSVVVTIKNAAGSTVRTLDMGARSSGVIPFAWDGGMDGGGTAADGAYTFSVSAAQGEKSVSATTLGGGLVNSIIRSSTGVSVNLGTLGNVALTDIQQIL